MQINNRAERAKSFETIGPEYHRLRPGYPDEAVDWMLFHDQGRTPQRVLDLGAGTGKLTDSLVERGLEVVAVEPSEQMLAVLTERLPQVEVHQASAESLPLPDHSIDAVVVGQAWHWMDPKIAGAEVARVLRPGGTLAMAWNKDEHEDAQPWLAEFDEVQRVPQPVDASEENRERPEVEAHPGAGFSPFEELIVHWRMTSTGTDFLELHKTHSAWLVADQATQAERQSHWEQILDANDARGEISLPYSTEAWRTHL